jgi:predicted PurR-regulated permease PerM
VATQTLRFTTGSILRAVVIVGAWFVALTVLSRATTAVVWFAEAVLIAALFFPVVAFAGRHLPRAVVVVGLTLVALATVALLSVAVFRDMQSEAQDLQHRAPAAARELEQSDTFGSLATRIGLADKVQSWADGVADRFQITTGDLGGLADRVGGNASAVLAVWILTIMLIASGPAMVAGSLSAFRDDTAARLRWVFAHAYRRWCTYTGLMAARSLVVGGLGYLAARALGLEVPVVLAVWLALWSFIPYVGLFTGGLLFALLAVPDSPARALAVLVAFVVVQVLDAVFVQHRIDRATMRFGVFLTLAAALVGFSLYGGGGLVLAVALVQFAMSIVADLGALNDPATPDPGLPLPDVAT